MSMMRCFILLAMVALATMPVTGTGQAPAPSDSTGALGAAALTLGTAVENGIRSGDVHTYSLSAGAGDLVSGTLDVKGPLAGTVAFVAASGAVVDTLYFEGASKTPIRLGFVAPVSGTYSVQLRAADRFGSGPQWALGAPVPVVGTASGGYVLRLDAEPVASRMREVQPPAAEGPPGSRLTRLVSDLQNGSRDALESFWREVQGVGPIVQDVPGNSREVDVTFVWRAIYDTRNVLLVWCPRTEECYMSRLPGTDVWYKTVRLRRGSRVVYSFSPNHRDDHRGATQQSDPLHTRYSPDDPTYPYKRSSVLSMPEAPDEQWVLRQPVSRGAIEERMVTSAVLRNPVFGAEREIWIYTPPGYAASAGPYPLLVLLDGAAYVSNRFGNALATLDNLINDGRIRPVIVIFDPGNRGGGVAGRASYAQALVQELLPMVRASYSISTRAEDIVLGGSSAGGVAAAEIALSRPDLFGNVLSQSGAFRAPAPGGEEPNAMAQAFLAAPRQPIRFYLDAGLYDNVPSAHLPVHELVLDETNLMGNRHLRDVLRAKGYDVTYREVGGGHDWVHWRAMLADGLMTLLGTQISGATDEMRRLVPR